MILLEALLFQVLVFRYVYCLWSLLHMFNLKVCNYLIILRIIVYISLLWFCRYYTIRVDALQRNRNQRSFIKGYYVSASYHTAPHLLLNVIGAELCMQSCSDIHGLWRYAYSAYTCALSSLPGMHAWLQWQPCFCWLSTFCCILLSTGILGFFFKGTVHIWLA